MVEPSTVHIDGFSLAVSLRLNFYGTPHARMLGPLAVQIHFISFHTAVILLTSFIPSSGSGTSNAVPVGARIRHVGNGMSSNKFDIAYICSGTLLLTTFGKVNKQVAPWMAGGWRPLH